MPNVRHGAAGAAAPLPSRHSVRAASYVRRRGIQASGRCPFDSGSFNRISVLMAHTVRYAFEPQARLARDCDVSRSTISRLIRGRCRPSYELVRRVVAALDAALEDRPPGHLLDAREVFSPDGTYPTQSGCALCDCAGCMPEEAYDRDGTLRPEYQEMRSGDWTLAPATLQEGGTQIETP